MAHVCSGNHLLRSRIVRPISHNHERISVLIFRCGCRICVSGYAIAQTSIQRELGVSKTVSSLGITLFTVTFGVRTTPLSSPFDPPRRDLTDSLIDRLLRCC